MTLFSTKTPQGTTAVQISVINDIQRVCADKQPRVFLPPVRSQFTTIMTVL